MRLRFRCPTESVMQNKTHVRIRRNARGRRGGPRSGGVKPQGVGRVVQYARPAPSAPARHERADGGSQLAGHQERFTDCQHACGGQGLVGRSSLRSLCQEIIRHPPTLYIHTCCCPTIQVIYLCRIHSPLPCFCISSFSKHTETSTHRQSYTHDTL